MSGVRIRMLARLWPSQTFLPQASFLCKKIWVLTCVFGDVVSMMNWGRILLKKTVDGISCQWLNFEENPDFWNLCLAPRGEAWRALPTHIGHIWFPCQSSDIGQTSSARREAAHRQERHWKHEADQRALTQQSVTVHWSGSEARRSKPLRNNWPSRLAVPVISRRTGSLKLG